MLLICGHFRGNLLFLSEVVSSRNPMVQTVQIRATLAYQLKDNHKILKSAFKR